MRLLYNPFSSAPIEHDTSSSWLKDADKFRAFNPDGLWQYDPWTGKPRDKADLIADPVGYQTKMPKDELGLVLAAGLRAFLSAEPKLFGNSDWYENHQLKVYVRNQHTYMGLEIKERHHVLSISNVTVFPPHRGKGLYNQIIALFEERAMAMRAGVCVESVGNPAHHAIYASRGYIKFYPPGSEEFKDAPAWFFKPPRL